MVGDEGMLERNGIQAETDDLAHAFEAVLKELDRVRQESEAAHRQLIQRNRELAASAAIAQAASSGQLDLAATLERALQVVLEVTGLPAGWVLLLPEDGAEPALTHSAGLPGDLAKRLAGFRSPECQCAQVLESRQPLVVHPLHAGCPIRALELGNGRLPNCHATVPLLARSRVLGVLNLACDDPAVFDEQELALLGAIGQQLGVAIENARLWEELKQRDLLRGQLLEQAIAAQEDERRHIARELHDQTGQALTSLLVWLRALEAESDTSAGVMVSPARLQELKAIVADTLDGVRDLALELRPSALDDLGLVPALQRYVRTCQERHGLAIDFQTLGFEGVRLPPALRTALYRIAQEALTNVVQHACAGHVSLLLEARAGPRPAPLTRGHVSGAGTIVLIVEDDGCGFEAGRLADGSLDERWLGLSGMRERAELLGGRLTIESAPGAGTTVFVEIPLDGERGAHGG
jgi:signal transduction histidine kinase